MGWCDAEEGEALYNYAKAGEGEGVIVEIGSFAGKSAIYLGMGAKDGQREKVYTIDCHTLPREMGASWTNRTDEHGVFIPEDSFEELKKNIKKAELSDWVIPILGYSKDVARTWDNPVRLLFIDGSHDYDSVKNDFFSWEKHVVEGGIIGFHDSMGNIRDRRRLFLDVQKFIWDFVYNSERFYLVYAVESTSFFRKEKMLDT